MNENDRQTIDESGCKKFNLILKKHAIDNCKKIQLFFQNWSSLESLIRAISIKMNKVLRIFTGVYGILRKKNKKRQLTDLYLDVSDDNNKVHSIEVPLIIWKLVIDVKTNDSVAFFTSNDTDMDEDQIAHFSTLCKCVCDEFGYQFKSEPKSGITICCKYNDFIRHIQYLPIDLKKSNLLKNEARVGKAKRNGAKGKRNLSGNGQAVPAA